MKIEKVNEQQIRCTLTREDLLNRELKISELAYGTEKAKSLFRDLMQQAAYECGFEAEDIPLMIEAIPLNAECIVLIVTKVGIPKSWIPASPSLPPPFMTMTLKWKKPRITKHSWRLLPTVRTRFLISCAG